MKQLDATYVAAVALLAIANCLHAADKPNILWIVTDDQRPDSVSAYNRLVYEQEASPCRGWIVPA